MDVQRDPLFLGVRRYVIADEESNFGSGGCEMNEISI
jgi:hypothetical protein